VARRVIALPPYIRRTEAHALPSHNVLLVTEEDADVGNALLLELDESNGLVVGGQRGLAISLARVRVWRLYVVIGGVPSLHGIGFRVDSVDIVKERTNSRPIRKGVAKGRVSYDCVKDLVDEAKLEHLLEVEVAA